MFQVLFAVIVLSAIVAFTAIGALLSFPSYVGSIIGIVIGVSIVRFLTIWKGLRH